MGGFSTTTAIFLDEQDYNETGIRKIAAGMTHGSDYQWTEMLGAVGIMPGIGAEVIAQNAGGRTLGMLAAQFDEFFFNAEATRQARCAKRTMWPPPAPRPSCSRMRPAPIPGDTPDGESVLYQPYDPPWNHFSTKSTAHTVEFYQTASRITRR